MRKPLQSYLFIAAFLFVLPTIVWAVEVESVLTEPEKERPLTYRDSITDMEFVLAKGGCFEMGDLFSAPKNSENPLSELSFDDEANNARPVHKVCVDDFYIGRYEVTQEKWKVIMGNNPSYFTSGFHTSPHYPVECVNWYDIQEFLEELNKKSGKNYRLPTEAEWEYAARSGGKEERFAGFSNEKELYLYANFCDAACKTLWNTEDQEDGHEITSPVGAFRPNGLGLYDMTGNVWELCSDWYDQEYYKDSPLKNPQGPSTGLYRVLRGGSWGNQPNDLSTFFRYHKSQDYGSGYMGFRLAFTP